MTWEYAIMYAIERSKRDGRKIYVRGYQRTISHFGEWLYGTYDRPDPKITAHEFAINPRRSVRYRTGR